MFLNQAILGPRFKTRELDLIRPVNLKFKSQSNSSTESGNPTVEPREAKRLSIISLLTGPRHELHRVAQARNFQNFGRGAGRRAKGSRPTSATRARSEPLSGTREPLRTTDPREGSAGRSAQIPFGLRGHTHRRQEPPGDRRPASPAQQAASQPRLRVQRLPITWTLQMAQVSHSTSQLHMATAFHFLRENILSPPDLEPALPECADRTQVSSPSSTSAMAAAQNAGAERRRGRWARRGEVRRLSRVTPSAAGPHASSAAKPARASDVGGLGEASTGNTGAGCDPVVAAGLLLQRRHGGERALPCVLVY